MGSDLETKNYTCGVDGIDRQTDYSDNTDTWGYILKNCTSMNSVKTS
jgi:hypothetical protein